LTIIVLQSKQLVMNPAVALAVVAEWLESETLPQLIPRDRPPFDLTRLTSILAVVGPRRAGKTFFMFQLMDDLLARRDTDRTDILFVDFEDHRFVGCTPSVVDSLLTGFNRLTGKYPTYLFLDEIQHLPEWSRVVRTLHNQRRYRIVISGSNSELLAREIATELRGRYRDLFMLPFSLSEILRSRNVTWSQTTVHTPRRGKLEAALDQYLTDGGFPEVFLTKDKSERQRILSSYYRTLFYRDILERESVRARHLLESMMSWFLSTYSDLFSISRFEKHIKTQGMSSSKRTIANYLHLLEEAFFIVTTSKFSYSARKRVMNPRKIYLIDPGFASLSPASPPNRGKLLENAVAIELLRREQAFSYFKGKRECDFIITRDRAPQRAIQVCWELNEGNRDRELDGLVEALRETDLAEGLVLTASQREDLVHHKKDIAIRPAWEWMTGEDS
jgi:predicted AAA+ superfamily ATPase